MKAAFLVPFIRVGNSEKIFKKIVALVVDDDKRREILDGDPENGLHSELRISKGFNTGNTFFAQSGCRTADGTQVESTVFFT